MLERKEEENSLEGGGSSLDCESNAEMMLDDYHRGELGAEEEVELDQSQSIGLAAIDALFGAVPSVNRRPPLPKSSTDNGPWQCEVGCPLTFATRNGMLKHLR